jgi:hypothetical protein
MINYRLSSSLKFNFRQESMSVKKRFFTLLLLFTFHFSLFTIQACGLDIEDPTPPLPPVWVQKSLPEEWPERGIDAHESGGIYLEWMANQAEDIVAYYVYRAIWHSANDSIGDYILLTRLETISSPDLEYIDREAEIRIPYYYKLRSEDIAENISNYSDSLFYSLLPQLNVATMNPNDENDTLDIQRRLSWRYHTSNEMENYCLTILTDTNELILRNVLTPGNYVGSDESWQIPSGILLIDANKYIWRIDTGAFYMSGFETAGSESQWATFIYQVN